MTPDLQALLNVCQQYPRPDGPGMPEGLCATPSGEWCYYTHPACDREALALIEMHLREWLDAQNVVIRTAHAIVNRLYFAWDEATGQNVCGMTRVNPTYALAQFAAVRAVMGRGSRAYCQGAAPDNDIPDGAAAELDMEEGFDAGAGAPSERNLP